MITFAGKSRRLEVAPLLLDLGIASSGSAQCSVRIPGTSRRNSKRMVPPHGFHQEFACMTTRRQCNSQKTITSFMDSTDSPYGSLMKTSGCPSLIEFLRSNFFLDSFF